MGTDFEIMKVQHVRFLVLIFIGILILYLPACTPAPYHFIVVEKIAVDQDIIYARASQDCNFCEDIVGLIYYVSQDNGQTWEEITSPTEDVLQKLADKQNNQPALCLSPDSRICYQITGKEQVEISNDSGVTWQIDWQIPAGRKLYMERRVLGLNPDTIPFDIQTMESEAGYFVIVAMGNQGVLVKSSDGNWNRFAVGLAVPTPYQAANFNEAGDVLYSELYLSILIAVVSLVLLSLCVWLFVYINADKLLRKRVFRSCVPFLFSITLFLSYFLFIYFARRVGLLEGPRYYSFLSNFRFFIRAILFVVYASPIIGFFATWFSVIYISPNKISLLTFPLCIVFSIILYFGIYSPFLLWALGTISVYETALVISSLVGIIFVLIALITEFRIAVLAVRPISK